MIDAAWQGVRRILLVRLDNLGDVLVTTPAIHAVRATLPEAEISALVSPVGAQVARLNADIDHVIVYQAPWMDPWQRLPQDSRREQALIATLRSRRFDAAIVFTSFRQSPLPSAYVCYLADIPLRLAASIDGPGSLLTTRHKHSERMMHEVERGLDLVGAIGISPAVDDLVLDVPDGARAAAFTLLIEKQVDIERPLIVVHPGCSMPARTYPWERFAEVVNILVERLDATVLLSGADHERELVARIRAQVRPGNERFVHAVAGEIDFATFAALIETADLTITNNTGPMHLAAAVNTPVVALFALTNPPEQWGPWRVPHRQLFHDVPCRICYSRVCPYTHDCLRLVTPDMVVDAAAELLVEASAPFATSPRRYDALNRPTPQPPTRQAGERLSPLALLAYGAGEPAEQIHGGAA
jgi:ADP-heptose:LPS heptosyltransferase